MSNSIGMTEVLYGVVIANAIYEITLDLRIRNAMLVFLIGLLVADWVEYHLTLHGTEMPNSKYAMMLIMDILILLVWYLATVVPEGNFELFTLLVAVYFFFAGLWSAVIIGPSIGDLIVGVESGADWQIAIVFVGIYLVQTRADISSIILLSSIIGFWILRKSIIWYRLLSDEKAKEVLSA